MPRLLSKTAHRIAVKGCGKNNCNNYATFCSATRLILERSSAACSTRCKEDVALQPDIFAFLAIVTSVRAGPTFPEKPIHLERTTRYARFGQSALSSQPARSLFADPQQALRFALAGAQRSLPIFRPSDAL